MFHPLAFDDLSFPQAIEDFYIQKVVSKGIVKAFTKTILQMTTGFNVSGFRSYIR
jgi:hypothetical protein